MKNTYCNRFRKAFVCEYAQKYMARDGATPTIFGPSPLNNAREPSVCTINRKHCIMLIDLAVDDMPQCEMASTWKK